MLMLLNHINRDGFIVSERMIRLYSPNDKFFPARR
jgi:hypothetical protein